ncbi:hypothetical protein NERG_00326 [Nematocida ausubeli]|uniref:Uncharacterized protein n=1 Tax=Nematocida ausubeli (strain ATCC PRA-371 / ERTm2) TaxID=1913371 RepID=H8Z9Q5_NEMA1|nr:hypothetical protein NERG_00326 [Nematocida ausubeli]
MTAPDKKKKTITQEYAVFFKKHDIQRKKPMVYLMLWVLAFHKVFTQFEIEEITKMHKIRFINGESSDVINPAGPLNLMRGYIYNRNGYMYSKRLFSPEIDIDYKLYSYIPACVEEIRHKFDRNVHMDAAYSHAPTYMHLLFPEDYIDPVDIESTYMKDYHSIFIKLFYQYDVHVIAKTLKGDSFYRFLNCPEVKPHASYILAAMVLLSEGFDVPLELHRNKQTSEVDLMLWYAGGKNLCFSISITNYIRKVEKETNDNILVCVPEEVISFFIKYKNFYSEKNPSYYREPKTLYEFECGHFMNSKQFMIQLYLFEIMNSIKEAAEFITAVHSILRDHANLYMHKRIHKEAMESTIKMYCRCFLPDNEYNLSKVYDYARILCDVRRIKELHNRTPFHVLDNSTFIYNKNIIKREEYSKKKGKNIPLALKTEYLLLSMFKCMMYSISQKSYDTSHIPNAPSALLDFFTKYRSVREFTSEAMMDDWREVILKTKNPCVKYTKNEKDISGGIINLLYAISALGGRLEEDVYRIMAVQIALYKKEVPIDHILAELAILMKKIISSLSSNDYVDVLFCSVAKGTRENSKEEIDLFGNISISYSNTKLIYSTMFLGVGPAHTSFRIEKSYSIKAQDDIAQVFKDSKKFLKEHNNFIDHLVGHYIRTTLDNFAVDRSEKTKSLIMRAVKRADKEEFNNINALLLVLTPNLLRENLSRLMACIVSYTYRCEMTRDHPVIRFISNIIGYMYFEPAIVHRRIFPSISYAGQYSLYNKISLPSIFWVQIRQSALLLESRAEVILLSETPEEIVQSINSYIEERKGSVISGASLLLHSKYCKRFIQAIFKDNTTVHAQSIIQTLHKYDDLHGHMLGNILYSVWAHYIKQDKQYSDALQNEIKSQMVDYTPCDILNHLSIFDTISSTPDKVSDMQILVNQSELQ